MILAAAYRARCGAWTALVSDIDVATVCGITCDQVWWCECGIRLDGRGRRVYPRDVCAHLRAFGCTPRATAEGGT